ncbi:MAG: helix-turn-helix domain-containing protein [Thermoleophilia bacterium]
MSSARSVSVHRALASPARVRLLELLREAPEPVGAIELAERLGVHPNTVRAGLAILVDAGLATSEPQARTEPGRPKIVFSTSRGPSEQELGGYRLLASMLARALAEAPDAPQLAIDAGEAWGRYLVERPEPHARPTAADAIAHVVHLLDAHGFAPGVEEGPGASGEVTVCMRRCPFLELARANQGVVCSAHLGLLRGALAELGSELGATALEPSFDPVACVVRLGPRPDGDRSP